MARQLQERRRRQILEAARRLFGTRGYRHTNIADIAAELGMGHGTFYRYFDNKRDIFDHVVSEALGRIAAVTLGRDPTSPRTLREHAAQVDEIGRALYDSFIADTAAARLVFYEGPGVDEDTRDKIAGAFAQFASFTAAYLRNGKERGYLTARFDEDATAAALTAIVFEGIRHTLRADDPRAEAERWIATYQLLARGLAA